MRTFLLFNKLCVPRQKYVFGAMMQSQQRWATYQSKAFETASAEIAKTPDGKNPYHVMDMPISKATTLEDISKHFKKMARKCHPDHEGGSHEKMLELNAAYSLIKEHHGHVMKRWTELETTDKAQHAYRQHRDGRRERDEEVARSGGINRQNVKAMNKKMSGRSLKAIENHWNEYRQEIDQTAARMCARYEFAIEQGKFFEKTSMLNEITVRERWLRKTFINGLWEEVHELRSELLRRGTRNAQQSQLAEEMVAYAGQIQRKLGDDFNKVTQSSVNEQSRVLLRRAVVFIILAVTGAKFIQGTIRFYYSRSLTVSLKPALMSS